MKVLFAGMLLCASSAQAQLAAYGDWFIVNANDASGDVIAATATEDGQEILGYRCFTSDGKCRYVLVGGTRCRPGDEYPMLVNASPGSSLVTGTCLKAGDGERLGDQLLLAPYKPIEAAIENGSGLIGFAVPMESGAFRAVRFSLRGGTAAIKNAEQRVSEAAKARPPSSRPRSTTL